MCVSVVNLAVKTPFRRFAVIEDVHIVHPCDSHFCFTDAGHQNYSITSLHEKVGGFVLGHGPLVKNNELYLAVNSREIRDKLILCGTL